MDYQFLSQTMLFSGESPEEIKEMLSCLGAVTRSYGKGEIIYHALKLINCFYQYMYQYALEENRQIFHRL